MDQLWTLEELLEQSHRIQQLELAVPNHAYDLFTGEDTRVAPLLESLVLINPIHHDQSGRLEFDRAADIPQSLDHLSTPRLKKLDIIGYAIKNWSRSMFSPSLTHLTIHGYETSFGYYLLDGSVHLPIYPALNAIRCMTQLVKLVIAKCILPDFSQLPAVGTKVSEEDYVRLEHLEYLHLDLYPLHLCWLLDRLVIPGSAVMRLENKDDSWNYQKHDLDLLARCILSKFAGPTVIGPARRIPRTAVFSDGELHFWDEALPVEDLEAAGSFWCYNDRFPSPQLSIVAMMQSTEHQHGILTRIFPLLPLSDVQNVVIESTTLNDQPTDTHITLLSCMPSVTNLFFTALDSICGELRRMLVAQRPSPTNPEGAGNRHPRFLLPNLRRLTVKAEPADPLSLLPLRNSYIGLMLAIRERHRGGLRLRCLVDVDNRMRKVLDFVPMPSAKVMRWIEEKVLEADMKYDWLDYPGEDTAKGPVVPCPWYESGSDGRINLRSISKLLVSGEEVVRWDPSKIIWEDVLELILESTQSSV